MPGELSRQSYRDRLGAGPRREAERTLFRAVLRSLTSGQRNELANHYRYEAAGEPDWRMYIVDLIEGREAPDG